MISHEVPVARDGTEKGQLGSLELSWYDLHALHPECDQEYGESGEDEGKGRPDKLTKDGLCWCNAKIRNKNGHLDGARGKDEQCLTGH
jgi:hypothetical protein